MDIEKFKQLLTEHKCVIVEFEPSCKGNAPSVMRYEMKDSGLILECYDYNDTIYSVCNVHDEQAMADNFLLCVVTSMKPAAPRFLQRL